MPNPLEALKKAQSIGPEPWDDTQVTEEGMPLGPIGAFGSGKSLLPAISGLKKLYGMARGAEAAGPSIERVLPQVARQVAPTGEDVGALEGLLKYNLARVPSAMPKPAPGGFTGGLPPATQLGAQDIFNPHTAAAMERMYQQASPVYEKMASEGAFDWAKKGGTLKDVYREAMKERAMKGGQ